MKISTLIYGLTLLMLGLTAAAHAYLHKASPADGSVITASPSSLVLSFSKPVRLTALWIQKGKEPRRPLGPLPNTLASQFSVAAPPLQPGRYEVGWRVFSDDGHVAGGTIHFTLLPEHASAHH